MMRARGGWSAGAENRETLCCWSSAGVVGLMGYGGGDGDVMQTSRGGHCEVACSRCWTSRRVRSTSALASMDAWSRLFRKCRMTGVSTISCSSRRVSERSKPVL